MTSHTIFRRNHLNKVTECIACNNPVLAVYRTKEWWDKSGEVHKYFIKCTNRYCYNHKLKHSDFCLEHHLRDDHCEICGKPRGKWLRMCNLHYKERYPDGITIIAKENPILA